jgi:HK97 family phage portal protein
MALLDMFRRAKPAFLEASNSEIVVPESRNSLENPAIPATTDQFLRAFGLDEMSSASGVNVTIDSALGVPAIWAAVNFLSGTLAGLPLVLYKKTPKGRSKVSGGLAEILHYAVSDEMSSFDWRKSFFDAVFTGGRGFSYIERNAAGQVINIIYLDPKNVTIKRKNGIKTYDYKENGKVTTYKADEIIDLAFMLKPDLIRHYSPITSNKDKIGLAIAVTRYGAKFFQNGGVPPFVITGPIKSPGAITRASDDLTRAVKDASAAGKLALSLPEGHTITQLGIDPTKGQMIDVQRFVIEEIARIYSMPPTFLQDLSKGTYSNTEQQDLHFVKHTIKRWAEQFEQEINLKLFGRFNNKLYVELNLDGLLRGDYKTRMEGNAQAINSGQLTPNEARQMDNREALAGGDRLMIQGATVPLETQNNPITPGGN